MNTNRPLPALYDSHRTAPAVITQAGLTTEEVAAFCKYFDLNFVAVGDPDDWDNLEVFRAGTQTYPSRGRTVRFSKVLEWKNAIEAVGPRVYEGGEYLNHDGGISTTLYLALDDQKSRPRVVYRASDGQVRVGDVESFFGLVDVEGKLTPRRIFKPNDAGPVETGDGEALKSEAGTSGAV
ncbi:MULTISPECIES: hypothetical protein [Pseudomonas]|uniref:hypothetical protein n=1 Tax=Pseudomonas TaxID=286 RepID=UPI0018E8CB84|nr:MULTISPECIES: hypothetical protein [Pseudomonas]MBJ2214102.1 hypothetical protein [Pseudomonas carnis]MBP5947970.1 hypothetical protein [Pseudomonas sp. P9(2020)]